MNQLLIHGSIASRQRNVFLRNDGRGGFDEISGALGLDLDQDGRSFARRRRRSRRRSGSRGDGRAAGAAAARLPERFRRPRKADATIAVRLVGTAGNRDAIGARVTVETDRLRKTRIVQAGSGFLSQHSKELLIGLGASERIVKLTVDLAVGRPRRCSPSVPLNTRVRIVEGGDDQDGALRRANGGGRRRREPAARRCRPMRPGCTSRSRRRTSRSRTCPGKRDRSRR